MMEFINKCIDYVKANPLHGIIAAALAVIILVILIVVISLSAKRSRAKKRLMKQEEAKKASIMQAEADATAKAKADAEKADKEAALKAAQDAAKKAVEEKLEAQRIAAEQEEAAKLAEEEKAKVKAETAKKPAAKKSTAKKPAATKNEKTKEKTEVKTEVKAEEKTASKSVKNTKAVKSDNKQENGAVLYDELKNAEEENAVFYDENETDKAARYKGKWLICRVLTDETQAEEMYFFELHASNGEKLLSSEEYTSYSGALRGIATHKTNIEKGNFKITLSKKGDYIFKLLSGKNMLLCMGENYPTRARCESAIESTKRFAQTAVIDENVQDHVVKVPVEDDSEILPLPENYNGKWIISKSTGADGEDLFYFELFANNGEKLLSSEEYTTYIGAVNGIATHKANIEKGNFRISLTKRGDYIYKLLNGNGQLLCLGEHYKTKRLCQSAVDSVKRFAKNSPVLTEAGLTK